MIIAVDRPYALESAAIRDRLTTMEDRLRTRYHTKIHWVDANTMTIGGPGVRGTVHVDPDHLRLELELSGALRPLKARIEKLLAKELDLVTAPS